MANTGIMLCIFLHYHGSFFFVLNVSVVVRLIIKWVSRYEIPTGTGIAGLKQVVAPNYSTFHKLDCSSLLVI